MKKTAVVFIVAALMFVVRNGQLCATNETTSFDKGGTFIMLRLRTVNDPEKGNPPELKKAPYGGYWSQDIPLSQMALVLIDTWASQEDSEIMDRIDRNIREKLLPLLEAARKHGILIIHAAHNHPIHKLIKPLPGEIVLGSSAEDKINNLSETDQLVNIMKERNIKFLTYAGYVSNMCVLTSGAGLLNMRERSYMNIFVRDASIAMEMPELLPQELTHAATVFLIELNKWAVTTTVNDMLSALENAHRPPIK